MELKNLYLPFSSFSRGGPAILKSIEADHPYAEGKLDKDTISGRKVTVVFPENGYEAQTVKVSDPTDALSSLLKKATSAEPVYVAFDGFEASIYNSRPRKEGDRWEPKISAKATGVHTVTLADTSQSDTDEIDY